MDLGGINVTWEYGIVGKDRISSHNEHYCSVTTS